MSVLATLMHGIARHSMDSFARKFFKTHSMRRFGDCSGDLGKSKHTRIVDRSIYPFCYCFSYVGILISETYQLNDVKELFLICHGEEVPKALDDVSVA